MEPHYRKVHSKDLYLQGKPEENGLSCRDRRWFVLLLSPPLKQLSFCDCSGYGRCKFYNRVLIIADSLSKAIQTLGYDYCRIGFDSEGLTVVELSIYQSLVIAIFGFH